LREICSAGSARGDGHKRPGRKTCPYPPPGLTRVAREKAPRILALILKFECAGCAIQRPHCQWIAVKGISVQDCACVRVYTVGELPYYRQSFLYLHALDPRATW
jgi:hypothetical protein